MYLFHLDSMDGSLNNYPSIPAMDGYIFNGWDKIISLMPAENVTIAAQWIDKPTQFVEIVFSRVDLKEGGVVEIIKAYTSEEFTIEGFEVDDSTGESRFNIDVSKSEEFICNINGNRRGAANNSLDELIVLSTKVLSPSFQLLCL